MEMTCVSCGRLPGRKFDKVKGTKQIPDDQTETVTYDTKSGARRAARAKCPTCGTMMTRFLPKA